ncbi:ABC transporter ATP-binding protein [Aquirufa sp.]|jgi:ABC-type multidrug transport system ATPase subunit|uniref:ABC transporter ATP-binding protein n=1 Tax=Aquirufa sp. TaxID=2676249 RepID=UPI0037BFE3DA
MSNPIVSIKHLSKSFGSFHAVQDVNITVNPGDVYGFLGPNGAGKSTTMRCMLSLIQPDHGSIELFGKSIKSHRSEILARVGSLIEKPDFYKYLSAFKNLQLFSRISGRPSSSKEIMDMLEFVGLTGREKDLVGGFSHGMRQRLGIAQTLLHQPDLIVLDEPTTGLDPQGIIDMRNLILRLKNEQKKTIILSSHNLSEVELICNRMVIIHQGKSIVEGDVASLLNEEEQIIRIQTAAESMQGLLGLLTVLYQPVQINEQVVEISLLKDMIPGLNTQLVEAGIPIFAIEAKRKLEDYFINLLAS